MTDTENGTNTWVAEEYVKVNSPHVKTALAALALTGDALERGGTFAEVGCGAGEIARTVAERGFEVWASDASPSMVDATRQRCAGLPVHAEVRTVEQLELPRDGFDVIHSSWVLHWVSEAHEPLRRMAGALRPGGHLVLQWTGAQPRSEGTGLFGILRRLAAAPKWRELFAEVPPAMRDYPADDVAALLTDAGLELVHYEPELPHPFSRKKGTPLTADELAAMRVRFRRTWFASQAEVLGDRVDEFLDEALDALVAADSTDPHHARIVARRPR
ncbi:methyltransferase domain-containing protein [Streptomyces sp. NPDC006552]|uniref:class I SAM-dependent methyltransferase n=1 Tax=Streptomyces sp. NPDC006552 TaxID=3157179 RepID=UPI0033A1DC63